LTNEHLANFTYAVGGIEALGSLKLSEPLFCGDLSERLLQCRGHDVAMLIPLSIFGIDNFLPEQYAHKRYSICFEYVSHKPFGERLGLKSAEQAADAVASIGSLTQLFLSLSQGQLVSSPLLLRPNHPRLTLSSPSSLSQPRQSLSITHYSLTYLISN